MLLMKNHRIEALLATLPPTSSGESAAHFHPCYLGYFTCFNAERYYEAHDVLEHLWLQLHSPNRDFYQALIQLAGAYVHLQKHFHHPGHPKHHTRLRPASRLFRLAERRFALYPDVHEALDVGALRVHCLTLAASIEASAHTINPWKPAHGPRLHLLHTPPFPPDT